MRNGFFAIGFLVANVLRIPMLYYRPSGQKSKMVVLAAHILC